ncbi:ABC transporter substrate-binding protein [Lacisediminihabitans sp. FW035]
MRITLRGALIATVVASALLVTGCSSGGSTTADSGPVTITYWGWAPDMDKVVATWNSSHKDITVKYVKVDAGDAAVTKLLTAIKAGSGAPDLMQAEYQAIPTMVSADALKDISKDVDPKLKDKFSEGVWSSVTLGSDAVYGIPQDSGPMMFYYRKDVFDSLDLKAPATWDEYAADAKIIHDANPSQYLGTFSSGDAGQFAGLTQQAGASWWSTKGTAWSVNIDSAAVKKVAGFWGGLVEAGTIANIKQFTPEWNAALAGGTQVGWVSAVWAPGVLAGNAADTAGKWEMAQLPQWDASKPANGNWGGSAVAVTSQSKHVAAAVKFNTWLATNPTAVSQLVSVSAIYPADTVDSKSALSKPNTFFANQPGFYSLAAKLADTVQPFTYGPNVNVAYSAFNDEFGKAAEAKSKAAFLTAVDSMQKITTDDLKKNGFTVK